MMTKERELASLNPQRTHRTRCVLLIVRESCMPRLPGAERTRTGWVEIDRERETLDSSHSVVCHCALLQHHSGRKF